MSTRLTENRGLLAVAITVIRYRSSAEVTWRPCFCHGSPVGTNTTSSRSKRSATSLAATRWPLWMGANVPPITPSRFVSVDATFGQLTFRVRAWSDRQQPVDHLGQLL